MQYKEDLKNFIKEQQSRQSYDIVRITDQSLKYKALIVIDTLKSGRSSGGIRISDHIDEDEIISMARSMTLKYSYLQRGMGGAKCGIQIPSDCTAEKKQQILKSFGQKAAQILEKKRYIPYMDMNCTKDDLHTILRAANVPMFKLSDSSYFKHSRNVFPINSKSLVLST